MNKAKSVLQEQSVPQAEEVIIPKRLLFSEREQLSSLFSDWLKKHPQVKPCGSSFLSWALTEEIIDIDKAKKLLAEREGNSNG